MFFFFLSQSSSDCLNTITLAKTQKQQDFSTRNARWSFDSILFFFYCSWLYSKQRTKLGDEIKFFSNYTGRGGGVKKQHRWKIKTAWGTWCWNFEGSRLLTGTTLPYTCSSRTMETPPFSSGLKDSSEHFRSRRRPTRMSCSGSS